jgi:hypothetical protein
MRTVLYGIRLLIDNMIMHDKVYIQNQMARGESKIAERQRKRERGRTLLKMRDGVSINLIVEENIYGRFGRVIRNNQDAANDVFTAIRIFSLVICKRHFV